MSKHKFIGSNVTIMVKSMALSATFWRQCYHEHSARNKEANFDLIK